METASSVKPAHRRPLNRIGVGLWAVAAIAVGAMFGALQSVVAQGVAQGEARRAQTARQTAAWSQCNLLQGPERRATCLAQVR